MRLIAAMMLLAGVVIAQDGPPQPVQITKGPRVESVTADTAVIAWSTNVNASTLVRFGTDLQQLTAEAKEPWGGLTHRVTIRNLRPGTTYYFQAESNQGQGTGTAAKSDVATFTTRGEPTGNLPQADVGRATAENVDVLAGPVPQNVTEHTAEIWWESDRPSDTILKYGTDPQNLTGVKQKPWGDQVHRVELTGLQPGTHYSVAVMSPEGRVRARASFRTEPQGRNALRVVDGPRIEFIGNNSAVIAWTTNVPSRGEVRYGISADRLAETESAPGQTTHRATLRHLQPDTIYHFIVESTGATSSETVQTGTAQFKTARNPEEALRIPQP